MGNIGIHFQIEQLPSFRIEDLEPVILHKNKITLAILIKILKFKEMIWPKLLDLLAFHFAVKIQIHNRSLHIRYYQPGLMPAPWAFIEQVIVG